MSTTLQAKPAPDFSHLLFIYNLFIKLGKLFINFYKWIIIFFFFQYPCKKKSFKKLTEFKYPTDAVILIKIVVEDDKTFDRKFRLRDGY